MLKPHPWWLFWLNRKRWISIYPHIYHPVYINPIYYPAIISHEDVHLIQQQNYGLIKWIFKYIFNRKFRLHAEAEGIAAELYISKDSPNFYVDQLCSFDYLWAAKSKEEALEVINAAIKNYARL